MGRGLLLTANLPQLQNLIKRDPEAYREEFLQQWAHYNSLRELFHLSPDDKSHNFRELLTFIAQVSPCYPQDTAQFPTHLSALLLDHFALLSADLRLSIVQNLVMLRNKDVLTSLDLLRTLFPLLARARAAPLRSLIRHTILTDLKTANIKAKNMRLNRAVQAMLFAMLERGMHDQVVGDKGKAKAAEGPEGNSGGEALWAILLTKELWKSGVWNDNKTVSIVALGCMHPNVKVQSASMHFFLGETDDKEDDDSEDEGPDLKRLQHQRTINKKSRSGDRKLAKAVKSSKKKRNKEKPASANFPALQLINDPQTFAEKLYEKLQKHDKLYSLDHKILFLQLLSRVMGAHKLCVLGFYTYIVRYLTYHQLQVTLILVSLAQSVHDLTPPDALQPVLAKLAHEFVHPGVGPEVIAAGINAIREVCRRQPWAMDEDLLGDLVAYRKSRDKGVVTAARGLLALYREVNPGLLQRRERGKEASMGTNVAGRALPYGHAPKPMERIEGLELLEEHLNRLRAEEGSDAEGGDGEGDENAWKDWDVESDSESESSEEEGWIDVSSDDEGGDIVVSDSEDEGGKNTAKQQGKQKASGNESDEEKEQDDKMDEDKKEEKLSTLMTTKILTPADFAKLAELRAQGPQDASASGNPRKRKKGPAIETNADGNFGFLSEGEILGPRKKAKADYEERMASVAKGREGRERFGSNKGKKNKDVQSSSTNREKARNKPIMMVLASGAVRGKKKASLRDKQRKLRAHIERAKKSYH
ncbi:protein required for actin cytoskeleton organization and cell cycle progression [Auriculariales sp. MPI-PUGE-AT-0066]|nr:protein required for actin cytoskeleton organization and cell cycle progression [Auriculariales sp. MPI-PUGE-AT-0066]